MMRLSTREAAKKLGIGNETLSNYLRIRKLPAPETVKQGRRMAHGWTEEDIERARELLPKIANGRKTRHRKKHSAISTQQSVKSKAKAKPKTKKKPPPRAAVPHQKKK